MSRLVVFHGRAHKLPNDSMKADPVPGVWYVGTEPQYIAESIPRFTELIFDRALAEHCGRTCGPTCEGDCFAELYTAVANINDAHVPGRTKDEQLFDCLPWPPEPKPFSEFVASLDVGAGIGPGAADQLAPIAPPDAPNPAPKPSTLKTRGTRRKE